jgi:CBS domain-containing protein
MYDDAGVKIELSNPYEVKKLEAINPVHNKTYNKKDQESKQSKFKDIVNSEAKNEYKKIANIHLEEEVIHAYQLMHSEVITINSNESIYKCWEKMEQYDLKQIPTVGLNGKIQGLATMKNISKALIENLDNSKYIYHTSIDTIAIHDVITAEPISDIRRVAKVMVQYHLNSIPIVDGTKDKVVGIISRADILKAVSSNPHYQLWA